MSDLVLCYICGRRVALRSVGSHIARCEDVAFAANVEVSRPTTKLPRTSGEVKEWNTQARTCFEASLPSCGICAQKFASVDARDKHEKRCLLARSQAVDQPRYGRGVSHVDPAVAATLARAGPRACVCHYCGAGIHRSSLPHHLKVCETLWFATEPYQTKGVKADHLVATMPPPPAETDDVAAYNLVAAETHVALQRRTGTRAQCIHCGRKFARAQDCASHERRCFVVVDEEDDDEDVLLRSNLLWRGQVAGMKHLDVQHAASFRKAQDAANTHEPLGALCYLCGTACLIGSLERHLSACEARWDNDSLLMQDHHRRRPPRPQTILPTEHSYYSTRYRGAPPSYHVDDDDSRAAEAADAADAAALVLLDKYNDEARHLYFQRGAVVCHHCGRTFADTRRRDAHALRCGGRQEPKKTIDDEKELTAVCPICGRPCLLGSLLRHLDTCRARWEDKQRLRPVTKRRPCPSWPDLALPHAPGPHLEKWNKAVRAQRASHDCPGCPRFFVRGKARRGHVKKCCPELLPLLSDDSDDDERDGIKIAWGPDPTVMCFICGRRYGSYSIGKHLISCEARWDKANAELPFKARRNLVYPPSTHWPPPVDDPQALEEYNALAEELYQKASWIPCPRCHRTFADVKKRDKHAKYCCPDELQRIQQADDDEDVELREDDGCLCHVCGRMVLGKASFRWHVKKCSFRWQAANALEPPEKRLEFPTIPDAEMPSSKSTKPEIRIWNALVRRGQTQAHVCPGCDRRFQADSQLRKHMTACCPAKLQRLKEDETTTALVRDLPREENRGIPCHLCEGRILSKLSLPFHFSFCLRRFYADEDVRPAVEQRQPPQPPQSLLASDNIGNASTTEVPEEVPEESDDDYSDDDDDFEEAGSSSELILLCATCGCVRETEETIGAHVLKCRKRWTRRERLRPMAWRRSLPEHHFTRLPGPRASAELLERWRGAMKERQPAFVCACGRSFRDRDRLEKHQKGCQGPSPIDAAKNTCVVVAPPMEEEEIHPDRGVTCYLCGRRCLISSLKLHIDRCQKRWCEENPETEQPDPPTCPIPSTRSTLAEREAYSKEADGIFRRHCPRCDFCGRIFGEASKLQKHQTGGCPNLEWELTLPKTLAALDDDDKLTRDVRGRLGLSDGYIVNIEGAFVVEKTMLQVTGGVYGFRSHRETRAVRESYNGEGDGLGKLTGLKCRSGVGVKTTLRDALNRLVEDTPKTDVTAYSAAVVPFVASTAARQSTYRRTQAAAEREKRNRQLLARLKTARAVVRTTRNDSTAPKHCHAAVRRKRDKRDIERKNDQIGKALTEIYGDPESRKVGVKALNLVEKFAQRTALYDENKKLTLTTTAVPKALGVAQCAACGIRAYYGSDGQPMRQCECGRVSYCDATCCAVDAPAHALVCEHARGQRWSMNLAKYWVESRATLIARRALRRRPKPPVEAVLLEVAKERKKEIEATKVQIDTTGITKKRIHHENAKWASDDAKDAARIAAVDAEHRLQRQQNKQNDKLQERHLESKVRKDRIEDRIAVLDDKALAVAVEKRDLLRQLEASRAHELASMPPRRGGTAKKTAREERLRSEADAILHPKSTAKDIGAFFL